MLNSWIGLLKQHGWTQFQKPGVTLSHATDSLPGSATFGKEKTTFSPEHVCESDRGACVRTQLFSLGCHLVEIDGEKCPLKRKPVRWLSGNMRVCAAIAHWSRVWHSHHLEGAVWSVDEPQLSDIIPWEVTDCRTTVASFHQADGFC